MARRNISLPADLDERARREGLNVSALARQAIVDELDRRDRMAHLGRWIAELDEVYGRPSDAMITEAQEWVRSAVPVSRPPDQGTTDRRHGDQR